MSNTLTKNLVLSQSRAGQPTEECFGILTHSALIKDGTQQFSIEVPGVDPEEIQVYCDAGILSVECPRGQLSLAIDVGLDTNEIKADAKWGMLTLNIPKRPSRAVKVQIINGNVSVSEEPAKRNHASKKIEEVQ
jgi:hypothetical protein